MKRPRTNSLTLSAVVLYGNITTSNLTYKLICRMEKKHLVKSTWDGEKFAHFRTYTKNATLIVNVQILL